MRPCNANNTRDKGVVVVTPGCRPSCRTGDSPVEAVLAIYTRAGLPDSTPRHERAQPARARKRCRRRAACRSGTKRPPRQCPVRLSHPHQDSSWKVQNSDGDPRCGAVNSIISCKRWSFGFTRHRLDLGSFRSISASKAVARAQTRRQLAVAPASSYTGAEMWVAKVYKVSKRPARVRL